MTRTRSVAIYARISHDRDGTQLGVKRQIKDCREEADKMGWEVFDEYVDDDISAYSGKRRPSYERMLDDLRAGRVDAILAWHMDRLYRRPLDLEELIAICQKVGVTDLRTVSGSFDLGTGDGMLVARMLAAVAANESDSKRRRGKRKALEIAETGRAHRGGYRPFGFQADRETHDEAEAEIVRQLAARALAGESLSSLARWLEENKIKTVRGNPWRVNSVKQILVNPRTHGVRVHLGQPIGPGAWEPIITPAQGEALTRMLTDPARLTNRTARSYLLSGMCRCWKCGSRLKSGSRRGVRRYVCAPNAAGDGGCGGTSVVAEAVDQIVAEAVLIRLDSPDLHDALAGRARNDEQTRELQDQVDADTKQLNELAEMWADGMMDREQFKIARTRIEGRREKARKVLSGMAGTRAIDAYLGQGAELRRQWSELNLDRQVAITKTLVDHVVIRKGKQGLRAVDVERVQPVWRF